MKLSNGDAVGMGVQHQPGGPGTPDTSVGSQAPRRTSVSTSLPSTTTTTAPSSTAAGKVAAKAADLPYNQAGKVAKPGGGVAAQDPYSQQNFKQYGAPASHISPHLPSTSQAHISPSRHARSPGHPTLSPLTSSSAHRSPHSSSTLQVPPGFKI